MNITHEESKFLNACLDENMNEIKKLLPSVSSVNFETNSGNYPLKWAVHYENYEMLELLLDNGAIINWPDNFNHTALKYVGSLKMLNVLMDKGLDIHHNEMDENSTLYQIILFGDLNVAKALIGFGVEYKHLSLSKSSQNRMADIQTYTTILESIYEKERINSLFKNEENDSLTGHGKKKKI